MTGDSGSQFHFVRGGGKNLAIEVKAGRTGKSPGSEAFRASSPGARPLLVGGHGVRLQQLFRVSPEA